MAEADGSTSSSSSSSSSSASDAEGGAGEKAKEDDKSVQLDEADTPSKTDGAKTWDARVVAESSLAAFAELREADFEEARAVEELTRLEEGEASGDADEFEEEEEEETAGEEGVDGAFAGERSTVRRGRTAATLAGAEDDRPRPPRLDLSHSTLGRGRTTMMSSSTGGRGRTRSFWSGKSSGVSFVSGSSGHGHAQPRGRWACCLCRLVARILAVLCCPCTWLCGRLCPKRFRSGHHHHHHHHHGGHGHHGRHGSGISDTSRVSDLRHGSETSALDRPGSALAGRSAGSLSSPGSPTRHTAASMGSLTSPTSPATEGRRSPHSSPHSHSPLSAVSAQAGGLFSLPRRHKHRHKQRGPAEEGPPPKSDLKHVSQFRQKRDALETSVRQAHDRAYIIHLILSETSVFDFLTMRRHRAQPHSTRHRKGKSGNHAQGGSSPGTSPRGSQSPQGSQSPRGSHSPRAGTSPRSSHQPRHTGGSSTDPPSPRGTVNSHASSTSPSRKSRRVTSTMRRELRSKVLTKKSGLSTSSPASPRDSTSPSEARRSKSPDARRSRGSRDSPSRQSARRNSQAVVLNSGNKRASLAVRFNPRMSQANRRSKAKNSKREDGCCRAIKAWQERRREYIRDMYTLVLIIEEEEDYDWDDLDEDGNPRRKYAEARLLLRRYTRLVVLVYWDPLVEVFYANKTFLRCVLGFFFLIPVLVFLSAVGWLGYSLWTNLQYTEGSCVVAERPSQFELPEEHRQRNPPLVLGVYNVRRTYEDTTDRPKGHVDQTCEVLMPCRQLSAAPPEGEEGEERCVDFDSWNWADNIVCYYNKNDIYGSKGEKLYCVEMPSTLDREFFACVITGLVLVFAMCVAASFRWRARESTRQKKMAAQVAARREERLAEFKRKIANRADEEAQAAQQKKNKETSKEELK